MLEVIEVVVGAAVVGVSLLPLSRSKAWWVRVCDFPRLQIGAIGAAALVGLLHGPSLLDGSLQHALVAGVALAVLGQFAAVWRYSRLAPREVQTSRSTDVRRGLSLTMCNVLEDNRDAARLLAVLRTADADLILCVETDDWWRQQLDALRSSHPHTVQHALANTYGMLLYSRLPLHEPRIDFLVQDDVPSFQVAVELRSGDRVHLHCVHPRPPVPGEADSSLPREAELLQVARRVRESGQPAIVCGDLNDVAWSRSTRQFQKVGRLLDPRKGRGMFGTFHARYPGLRVPLDHIFHSADFRLAELRRLGYVGSDHFPVYARLSFEPDAVTGQSAPRADREDLADAQETVADAARDGGADRSHRIPA